MDESNHIATGLEWWQYGTYVWWTENPPLSRAAVAAFPYLDGLRLPPREEWDPRTKSVGAAWYLGLDALHTGAGYEANLRRARLGTLPFFLLAILATWMLARGGERPLAGVLAVGLTATLPVLLAHGAMATTDVAFLGTFLAALVALNWWIEAPGPQRAVVVGAAFALSILSKFSALVFFPLSFAALLVARRLAGHPLRPTKQGDGSALAWRTLGVHGALAAGTAALMVWAGYRFSVGRIDDLCAQMIGWFQILPPPAERSAFQRLFFGLRLPAPEFFHGLLFLAAHNADGHRAYLFGQTSQLGFWNFYPMALLVKTPLPFLAAAFAGLALLARSARQRESWPAVGAALAALAILAVSMRSNINLGIRHVLPILPLLAVAAAGALSSAIEKLRGAPRTALAVASGLAAMGQAGIAVAARPHHMAYFNALAGSDPAAVLLDSDLDWGQDFFQLRRELRERGIESLTIAYYGIMKQCDHGLPRLVPLVPGRPATGWVAISENYYRERNTRMLRPDPCNVRSTYKRDEIPPHPFAWLREHTPVAIVGRSIRLYHVPEPGNQPWGGAEGTESNLRAAP